jgi:carbamoyl-phosphate synthase large subunit
MWLDRHDGWGNFTVAEALSSDTVTVQTLWWNGELVGSQQRTRVSWANAGSTTTGVSGSTGIGVTSSDEETDATAMLAVGAVDDLPHGLYGVDMTRREDGTPCVTEINCGRFFTTAPEFYAQAGYNMAQFYVEMGQPTDRRGAVARAVDLTAYTDARDSRNPLPDGLRWIRAMDRPPILDRTQVREQVPA